MDRRGFMVVTGGALTGVAVSGAPGDVGWLTAATIDRVEHRLAELRHLDDALGGSQLHQLSAIPRW